MKKKNSKDSQKNREVEHLLHDISNPLTSIMSDLSRLKKNLDTKKESSDTKVIKLVEHSYSCATKIATLIRSYPNIPDL